MPVSYASVRGDTARILNGLRRDATPSGPKPQAASLAQREPTPAV